MDVSLVTITNVSSCTNYYLRHRNEIEVDDVCEGGWVRRRDDNGLFVCGCLRKRVNEKGPMMYW